MGLFGKKKEEKQAAAPRVSGGPKETTYFGKNIEITGNVSGDGDLIILGALEGEFDLKGKLQVAEPARITGTIKANDISIKGSIQGTITAVEKVHLDPTAKVKGHINSPKISVLEGARFDGEINMSGKKAQTLPTPPYDASASKDSDISEKK
jgi:cytoskeletal protein CcmA (bactofilin family)